MTLPEDTVESVGFWILRSDVPVMKERIILPGLERLQWTAFTNLGPWRRDYHITAEGVREEPDRVLVALCLRPRPSVPLTIDTEGTGP